LDNVTVAAHSTYTTLPAWYCAQDRFRFGLPSSAGCDSPYGIPQQVHGGLNSSNPSQSISMLQFNNVFINGSNIGDLLGEPYAFVFSGFVDPIIVDGVPHTVPVTSMSASSASSASLSTDEAGQFWELEGYPGIM
jgi:hypothetical protein